jgi:hypothetical protein
MSMPGLTADRSVYRSKAVYRSSPSIGLMRFSSNSRPPLPASLVSHSPNAVYPQYRSVPNLGGSPRPELVPPWVVNTLHGFAACDGVYVDLRTDRDHCGSCSNSCAGDGTVAFPDDDLCFCHNGGCACRYKCSQFSQSGASWVSCGTDCDSPGQCRIWRCTDLESDVKSCGTCGNACDIGYSCCAGKCCAPGGSCCPTGCQMLSSDVNNCGTCGNQCSFENGTGMCLEGVCKLTSCDSGYTNCNGRCVNLMTDPNNCTACGKTCMKGQICNGACNCPDELMSCNGVCVDIGSDSKNCGKCSLDCGAGKCCAGLCCPAGKQCCGGACVDINSDQLNCGTCNHKCDASCSGVHAGCANGVCAPSVAMVKCFGVDGSTRCIANSHSYPAFDAVDAKKCADNQNSGFVNSCGADLQTFPVAVFAPIDPMLCPTGWTCQENASVQALLPTDAISCLQATKFPVSDFLLVSGQCSVGACKPM